VPKKFIFVTVGTSPYDFSRLLKEVDKIAKKSKKKFIVSIGNSKYKPKHCEFKKFFSNEDFDKFFFQSELIITHAGEGNIIKCLKYNRPFIIVPRLKEKNEHIDEHQEDLAERIGREYGIPVIKDMKKLESVIFKSFKKPIVYKKKKFERDNLVNFLRKYIKEHKIKKVGLICANGGHLVEMLQIIESFSGYNTFFVTFKGKDTENMKAYKFEDYDSIILKEIILSLNTLPIFIKERPDLLISTGGAIAIPFFILGKLFGIKTIFIDSFTRTTIPSGTGRILYHIADVFLVQWRDLLKFYGKKAKYKGKVL